MSDSQDVLTTETRRLETYTVGGVRISCVDRKRAVDNFFQLVSAKSGGFVTVRDAHGVVEAQADNRLRDIINSARMTLPDGVPIVWVGKIKNADVSKVTGSDFFSDIVKDQRASRIRHFFYGGAGENTSRLVAGVTEILGANAIAGWHSPPFRSVGAIEYTAVLDEIAASRPDVIWVGLSTPKQEYWMANHAAYFPNAIFVGVGAVFDFHSGAKRRAPTFFQRLGLEWFFRIVQEPRRLLPRYGRVVPGMIKILITEVIHR